MWLTVLTWGKEHRGPVKCTFPEDYDEECYDEFADAKREFRPRDPRRLSRPPPGVPEETEARLWRCGSLL